MSTKPLPCQPAGDAVSALTGFGTADARRIIERMLALSDSGEDAPSIMARLNPPARLTASQRHTERLFGPRRREQPVGAAAVRVAALTPEPDPFRDGDLTPPADPTPANAGRVLDRIILNGERIQAIECGGCGALWHRPATKGRVPNRGPCCRPGG